VSERGSAARRLEAIVPAALDGERVDRVVAFLADVSRAAAATLVASGAVLVDGRAETRRSAPLHAGSAIAVSGIAPVVATVEADPTVPLDVVAEDHDVIVVDKRWDVVVHPGAGRSGGTLVNGLVARYPELLELVADGLSESQRPGIVHRLDRGTSGLLVVARSPRALVSLREQMAAHTATRRYAALVHGFVEHDRGIVDAPLARSARRPTQMAVSSGGREARTAYEVVARIEEPFPSTLVTATLETGRTHQVRVHLAAIGHPVVGDTRYQHGRRPRAGLAAGRFFLHADRLSFDHPGTGRRVTFRSALPEDLAAVLGEVPTLPG
jgi:23S rRNA pseudouridine1911/1915/1917 synthase